MANSLATTDSSIKPNKKLSTKKLFGLEPDRTIYGFPDGAEGISREHVPDIDPDYVFDPGTTRAILAGFEHNRRVLVQGYHGTGKSTHIEQISARLNWPCVRINLDSHISRLDLVGKDQIVLRNSKQVTEFQEGILPWALQRPCALCFDEYDAGRPDVMFVIQRVLEVEGKLTLLDQSRVIRPHPYFRLFATSNTVGLGDSTGLYHGVQQINQGQIDRWSIVTALNYLNPEVEFRVVLSKVSDLDQRSGHKLVRAMVALAEMTRNGFRAGDISTVMSPRTVITWAENYLIFDDIGWSFVLSFLNKCDDAEKPIIGEYFQRCFDFELDGMESAGDVSSDRAQAAS